MRNMAWHPPLKYKFCLSSDGDSYKDMGEGVTAIPLVPHPGAFGVVRKHHIHEGVDLYCADGDTVYAVEGGTVVAVIPFTGAKAGSDWWHDTDAVLVEGGSGVVVYGEIVTALKAGDQVSAGGVIGRVKTVLKKDKGRPMAMLHIELHEAGARDAPEWPVDAAKPETLRDPTPYLKGLVK